MIGISYFFFYLLLISTIGGFIFYLDKLKAKKGKWRVPEATLHLLELLGAVFVILYLMRHIHHKNSKSSYYLVTYLILVAWLIVLYFAFKNGVIVI